MQLSIKFDTDKSGWCIYWGSHVIISKKIILFISLKIFVLANSSDPNEMLRHETFHLGIHCLPKYLFGGFLSFNNLTW